MALTRDGFVTEICDVVGKKESASAVSGTSLQARVRTYLNWGQKRIARAYSFHELNNLKDDSATADGVKRYPLTSGTNNLGLAGVKDIRSIRLIDSENSRKLDRWNYRKLDKRFPYPTNYAEARPSIYARDGNNLEMFRIPDAIYTLYIRYSKWPTDFITGGQTSDYENKDELIITAGILETYLALEEYADAAVYLKKFIGELDDAIDVEGDVDWEPEAEPHDEGPRYRSGEPWLDPFGDIMDPLYGYGG